MRVINVILMLLAVAVVGCHHAPVQPSQTQIYQDRAAGAMDRAESSIDSAIKRSDSIDKYARQLKLESAKGAK